MKGKLKWIDVILLVISALIFARLIAVFLVSKAEGKETVPYKWTCVGYNFPGNDYSQDPSYMRILETICNFQKEYYDIEWRRKEHPEWDGSFLITVDAIYLGWARVTMLCDAGDPGIAYLTTWEKGSKLVIGDWRIVSYGSCCWDTEEEIPKFIRHPSWKGKRQAK